MYKFRCKSCDTILEKGHVIDACPVCKSKNIIMQVRISKAKKLVEMYRNITKENIANYGLQCLTGFGLMDKCIICCIKNRDEECNGCIHVETHNEKCYHQDTYIELQDNATLENIKARADFLEQVILDAENNPELEDEDFWESEIEE
jgi:hypothetical protein